MLENLKVERKLYKGVWKIKPLNLGNSTPLLTMEFRDAPGIYRNIKINLLIVMFLKTLIRSRNEYIGNFIWKS